MNLKSTLLTILLLATLGLMASPKVKTGIEVLRDNGFKSLQGKRVGLITNPTGVDAQLKPTIDILNEAPGVKLVALYGPEHGVRGDIHAGDHVETAIDKATGVPAVGPIGQAAGMNGIDKLDPAEIEVPGAAVVQRVGLGNALLTEPHRYLVVGDDGGAGAFGNADRIANVIAVAVSDQDIIRFQTIG